MAGDIKVNKFALLSASFLVLSRVTRFSGPWQAKLLQMVDVEGKGAALQEIGEMMDKPSLDFNIIEP